MDTPFIGFANVSLSNQPVVHAGDIIVCSHCGGVHELMAGEAVGTGAPTESLLFYLCGESLRLAAIDNFLVAYLQPDYAGEMKL